MLRRDTQLNQTESKIEKPTTSIIFDISQDKTLTAFKTYHANPMKIKTHDPFASCLAAWCEIQAEYHGNNKKNRHLETHTLFDQLAEKHYHIAAREGCSDSLIALTLRAEEKNQMAKASAYMRTVLPSLPLTHPHVHILINMPLPTIHDVTKKNEDPQATYHLCIALWKLHQRLTRYNLTLKKNLTAYTAELQQLFTFVAMKHSELFAQLILIDGWGCVDPLIQQEKKEALHIKINSFNEKKSDSMTCTYSSFFQIPSSTQITPNSNKCIESVEFKI